ncbi:MAG: cytochrome P450 [Caldilineaceae bacterium]
MPIVTQPATQPAAQSLPGPSPVPLLGKSLSYLNLLRNAPIYLLRLYQQYGELVGRVAGDRDFIFAFGPAYNHEILAYPDQFYTRFPVPAPNHPAIQRLQIVLPLLNGAIHEQHRRLMMPGFHRQAVTRYIDTITTLTDAMLAQWRLHDRLDLQDAFKWLTVGVIVRCLLGLTDQAEVARTERLIDQLLWIPTDPALLLLANLPSPQKRRAIRLADAVHGQLRHLIACKRAGASGNDLLSLLINARDAETGALLSDDELVGETMALFAGGFETTTATLSLVIFLLLQHPQALAAVTAELEETLQGDPPTAEQVHDGLPVLDRTIRETLRLFPPLVWRNRTVMQPWALGDLVIQPGAVVIMSAFVTQRMPHLFAEPDRFLPERWLTHTPSPYAYLPFGGGARHCLGYTLAMAEMKIVLARLLQRFTPVVTAGARLHFRGTRIHSLQHGLPVTLQPPNIQPAPVAVTGNVAELVK